MDTELKEQLDMAYQNYLDSRDDFFNADLRIKYATNEGEWDEVNQIMTEVNVDHTLDVVCTYREVSRVGQAVSSQIVSPEAIPTGLWLVFLKFEDKLNISQITNYVDKSLRFILYPGTEYEMVLFPKVNSVKMNFLNNVLDYPMEQRWEATRIQEG